MKLNTEDNNVELVTLSVEQVREIETGNEEVDTALDNAQAPVFGGDAKKAYLIIEIVP